MKRAVALDARLLRSQDWFGVGAVALLVVVGGVTDPVFCGFMALMWIVMTARAHRDLAAIGRVGALQCVLGVPRADAVRARYVGVLLRGVVVAVAGLVVAVAQRITGHSLSSSALFLLLDTATLVVAGAALTLGYIAPRTVQVFVVGVLVTAVFFVPMLVLPISSVVPAAGIAPSAAALLIAVALVFTLGSRLAVRAHSRSTL